MIQVLIDGQSPRMERISTNYLNGSLLNSKCEKFEHFTYKKTDNSVFLLL